MLSVRDIETKTFSRSKTGYKEEEVEAFLDEIIVDYTSLLEEKESLGKKVIALSEKLENIRDEQEARMQSLLSTQKSYDEVMRTAKMNSEALINDAKKKADDILKTAKEQADGLTSDAAAKVVEIEKDGESKKAEYNALASEIETVKKAIHVLCDKFTSDVENLPELAKKELAAITVTEPAPRPAPVVEEETPVEDVSEAANEDDSEIDDSVLEGKTKVIPVVKETKIADVPRDVTREKINRALEIADEEDEDMVGDDDDEDYESDFYSRKRGGRRDDGRAAKIRNLFGSDDSDDSDEYDEDESDEFDDEFEEEPKKKKHSFFGFGKKKKSRDDDYDDYDDYDDDYDNDDDYYDDED